MRRRRAAVGALALSLGGSTLQCAPPPDVYTRAGISYTLGEGVNWTREELDAYEACAFVAIRNVTGIKHPDTLLRDRTSVEVTMQRRTCPSKPHVECGGWVHIDNGQGGPFADAWVDGREGLDVSSVCHELAHAAIQFDGRKQDYTHTQYEWALLNNPCQKAKERGWK